jgi:CRP/FNR family transcriptional regulator, cyclic AMP receptor protein
MIESRYLEDSLENIQKLMVIPGLKNFETKSVGNLLKLSKIREYQDGEAIIKEGDQDPWMYILLSGKIRISKENHEIGLIEKSGEIFGEMRIIDSMARSASVSAIGKTVCLAVNTTAKNRLSTFTPEEDKLDLLLLLYRVFAEYMCIRLRATNEELVAVQKKIKHLISKI